MKKYFLTILAILIFLLFFSENIGGVLYKTIGNSVGFLLMFLLTVVPLYIIIYLCTPNSQKTKNKLIKKNSKMNIGEKKVKYDMAQTSFSYNTENGLMNKIKRLKDLYKNGTLTKVEFEKAKNKLLK